MEADTAIWVSLEQMIVLNVKAFPFLGSQSVARWSAVDLSTTDVGPVVHRAWWPERFFIFFDDNLTFWI